MISILASIFNEPTRFIQESVKSILAQTFNKFELIIINDNPDRKDVETLIDSFHDQRIKFFQNEHNIGLAMSMNKAVSLSKGDILVRMDADDVAEPNRLEDEYRILIENEHDLVFSSYSLIDEQSNPIPRNESISHDLFGLELSKMVALNPTCIHHPTVMMRRSMFEKVGGYRDFPCAQDADLWMRMQEAGCEFYRISKPLLRYRVNSQSVSRKKWFLQRLTWYYIFGLSMERLNYGRDSFSEEHYQTFLRMHGLGDEKAEARLRKSYNMLERAKRTRFPISVVYRLVAFSSHLLLRKHYFEVRHKERVLKSQQTTDQKPQN